MDEAWNGDAARGTKGMRGERENFGNIVNQELFVVIVSTP